MDNDSVRNVIQKSFRHHGKDLRLRSNPWRTRALAMLFFCLVAGAASAQSYPDPLVNTAQVTLPSDIGDPDTGNNTASDSNALAAIAALSVTKTLLTPSPVTAGGTVSYEIVVSNAGPSTATDATVSDTVPPELGNVTWTCVASSPASSCGTANGTGDISLSVTLIPGDTITITVTGTAPNAGTVSANTVTVAPPGGTTDPDPGDNTSTVPPIPVTPVSDLSVTKTLTSASPAPAGSTVAYQIVVSNAGPSDAIGAAITDTVPAELSNVSWTCTAAGASSCDTPAGSGNVISLSADIVAGAGNDVTINVTGTAPASGTIGANTATVAEPPGTTDPDPGNNTSTVPPVPVSPVSNLSVLKLLTSVSPAPAGSTVTYQIVVSNSGPSDAIGASIADAVPAELTSVTWTCVASGASSCGVPGGSGNSISLTANVVAGAGNSVTIDVSGTAPDSGTIGANTVTVTPPGGTTDPDPGDNTSTVPPVPVSPISNLSIVKTLTSASPAQAGSTVTYQIVVSNAGPSDAIGATIADGVPIELTAVTWTCSAAGTSACGVPGGSGNSISLTADIAAGAGNAITIDVSGTAPASGTIGANTATVTPPGGTTDPDPGDNTTTVPPVPVEGVANLAVVKTLVSASPAAAGSTVSYQIVVSNAGPSDAIGATISDTVPAQLTNVAWSCAAAGVSSCGTASGTGNVISLAVDLAVGAGNAVTINVTGTAPLTGTIDANTATVTPPIGITDPDGGDNTSTVPPIPVTPRAIVANDDSAGPVNGASGGTSVINVLDNDTLGGSPVNPADITFTPNSASPLTINPDGTVDVAPNTPAGTYTATYQICEDINPANCDDATVTVVVAAAVIDAVDDAGTAPASGGTAVADVLVNDTLGGQPATIASVTLTQQSSSSPNVTLDAASGAVNVAAGTAAGVYTLVYRICEQLNPGNCDDATVTVTVSALAIVANDDTAGPVNGTAGGDAVINVLTNDTLGGAAVNPADVTLTPTSVAPITINPDGSVDVAPNTPAGTYTATYLICENASPTNCDSATVTVSVVAAAIDAIDDSGSAPSTGGIAVANVLVNDTLNGQPATTATVTLTQQGSSSPNVTLDTTNGAVNVAAGTAVGTYTLTYRICEQLNPGNCDDATVTVTVAAAGIDAVDDSGSAPSTGGTAVANVLVNDTLGGQPATTSTVTLTQQGSSSPNITLDVATGAVNAAPGTPAGTYTLTYRICEPANTTNCDDAVVTVNVAAAPIDAVDDAAGPVYGATGATAVTNVLGNDSLGGTAASLANVMLAPSSIAPITIGPDGSVDVAPNTPAGTYTATYRICETSNPANCDNAIVTVSVVAAPIDAVDDSGVVPSTGGVAVANVLANDTLNGQLAAPASVALTQQSTSSPNVALDVATGAVNVAAGTAAGDYMLVYRICEQLNPDNCDDATFTVTVTAAPIVANDDNAGPVGGASGATAILNVLTNDTLGGAAVDPADVTLAPVNVAPITINPDGSVDVAPGTPAGTYAATYQICENANPTNCDDATVTVSVAAAVIDAVDDDASGTPVNGYTGGVAVASVLVNDTLDGVEPTTTEVELTLAIAPASPGISLDTTSGAVTVAAGTVAGTHTLTYRICERLNPANCDTALVTIVVTPAVIDAVDDDFTATPIEGLDGGATSSVLGNDTLNEAWVIRSQVVMVEITAEVSAAAIPGITLNDEGTIAVAPRTAAGTYRLAYRICEVLNPTNCDAATAVVAVIGDPLAIRLTKRAGQRRAKVGDLVRYTVTAENVGSLNASNVTLVDAMPAGFTLVDGSLAVEDGDDAGSLGGIGSPLSVAGLDVAAGQQATITYYLRVGAGVGPGIHTNRAVVQDASGQAISNVASADVEVSADPLLDDSLIVGSVFDDRNGDGTQEAGERGIPGVRIASIEGLITETDAFGRYHLAGIPGGAGSRGRLFILKVDPSTLPAGAKFTTGNPRVRRITPGVPVRFDFGVKLLDSPIGGGKGKADIELGEVVFARNSAEIPAESSDMLDRIAAIVREYGGGRITVVARADAEPLAFQRAQAVQAEVVRRLEPALVEQTRIDVATEVDPLHPLVSLDKAIGLSQLLFDTDKAEIRPQYRGLIREIARAINERDRGVLEITGHADARGSDDYNMRLGMRRAQAVFDAIAVELTPEVRQRLRVEVPASGAAIGAGSR